MRHDLARLSTYSEQELAALTPLPHEYATIYICVAWAYWFGLHAEKPLKIQLRRLQDKYPHLRCGRTICAAIHAAPHSPRRCGSASTPLRGTTCSALCGWRSPSRGSDMRISAVGDAHKALTSARLLIMRTGYFRQMRGLSSL